MALDHFHPVIHRWFSESLGQPTAAQVRGWAAIREKRHTLIAAPTGSGKTLAAFLTALDDLFQEGLRGPLPDEVRVVYVSPLKALSADKSVWATTNVAQTLLPVQIIDEGHRRAMDLTLEIPRSPLETVMSHEVWEEYYDRLTELIGAHRTTLIFVNTRRMAERLARHLSDRLSEDVVTAHHGSLSKEKRLDAENRLKNGQLKALVATASLELGIDIGHVDLVCQIGSPHRIATLLQRVGRSGHSISGLPKGRVFPMSRDDLVECAAMLRSVRRGELDSIVSHDAPLDVLAQQIVAEVACRDYGEDELFALARRAWPYRDLRRRDFDAVLAMTADGFATRRGRQGALVHHDEINGRVRGRRGARLLAITSGGAIPEVADYRVVLDPDETFIGTLNEDFAIESAAGDIFQLGNSSWRVLQVATGIVRVADAKGAPPTIPFWFGEAPARSDELSRAVSDLRADIDRLLEAGLKACATDVAPPVLEPRVDANTDVAL